MRFYRSLTSFSRMLIPKREQSILNQTCDGPTSSGQNPKLSAQTQKNGLKPKLGPKVKLDLKNVYG